jgi:Flp pilus assembly protein TadG
MNSRERSLEKGQALILIVFGIIALIGMTGLAIDGGSAYSDRRNAQNAADTAALAAALAQARGGNINSAATDRATNNGYDNNGTSNTVTVASTASPSGACPATTTGLDITVTITSTINTSFAQIIGIPHVTNTVLATARSCGSLYAPISVGNAVVGLDPNGTAFEAKGNPTFNVTGGGIFSNSAADCKGSAGVTAPSLTSVGPTTGCSNGIPIINQNQSNAQLSSSLILALMPPTPTCDGTAVENPAGSGNWYMDPNHYGGIHGSKVAFDTHADMVFHDATSTGTATPGLYCITNSPGNIHGNISGDQVTFYSALSNFNVNFNGGGSLTASAPQNWGYYSGVLFFLAPQTDSSGNLLNTQIIELHGNGNAGITGSILAPSAQIGMWGNSGTNGDNTQIVGYDVTAHGGSTIDDNYNSNRNWKAAHPESIQLIK